MLKYTLKSKKCIHNASDMIIIKLDGHIAKTVTYSIDGLFAPLPLYHKKIH